MKQLKLYRREDLIESRGNSLKDILELFFSLSIKDQMIMLLKRLWRGF